MLLEKAAIRVEVDRSRGVFNIIGKFRDESPDLCNQRVGVSKLCRKSPQPNLITRESQLLDGPISVATGRPRPPAAIRRIAGCRGHPVPGLEIASFSVGEYRPAPPILPKRAQVPPTLQSLRSQRVPRICL